MTLLIQSLTVTLIVPAITLIATFIHSFAGRRGTVPYFSVGRSLVARTKCGGIPKYERDTKFMNILFVCTGNTCRSAMAAAIMDKIAVENDLDVFIESAGIFAEDGQGASENAIKALMKYGIDLSATEHSL